MRIIGLFILPLIAFSCQPNTEEWHATYAQYKCDYKTLTEEREHTVNQRNDILTAKKDSIQKLIETKFQDQLARMQTLRDQIQDAEKVYTAEYRKAQDEQSAKYGHVSTPAYEKQLQRLDNQRSIKTSVLVERLRKEESELKANSDYVALSNVKEEVENALKNVNEEVKEMYKSRVDSLQEKVNNHRIHGKEIKRSLDEKEGKAFQALTDSINNSPCKYVK